MTEQTLIRVGEDDGTLVVRAARPDTSGSLSAGALMHLLRATDRLSGCMVRLDASGAVLESNGRLEQLLGKPVTSVVGRSVNDLLRGATDSVYRPSGQQEQTVSECGWSEGISSKRLHANRPNGRAIALLANAYHIGGPAGIETLLLLEPEISGLGKELDFGDSSTRFQALTRLAPVGIVELDAGWQCLYANDKWCDLSRLGIEDSLAGGWVDAFHRDDVDDALVALHDHISRLETFERELRLQTPLGEVTWVSLSASGVIGRGGQIARVLLVINDITERHRASEKLRQVARSDALTGLSNRQHFLEQLSQAFHQAGHSVQVAVLFLDLDGFKAVNDTLGHHAGDELLRRVARRLTRMVAPEDTVARLGGDEFTVILARRNARQEAALLAETIILGLKEPFVLDAQEVFISASIGIAVGAGHSVDEDALVRQADVALYRAKQAGRARHMFYSPELDRARRDHSVLVTRLQGALEAGEFELHYQPQRALEHDGVVGFEALLRWSKAPSVDLQPIQIISVLENAGLIGPVGEWVLMQACKDYRAWLEAGLIEPSVRMSINVSVRQLGLDNFVERFGEILLQASMPAERLVVELTESTVVSTYESGIVSQLKALGLSISIDDFGTGFSSLAYLGQLPVDELKIDRSFIQNIDERPQSRPIVKGILGLAASLDIDVVAEGVEDDSILPLLAAGGCKTYQGYQFSRPLPAAGIVDLLR